MWNYRVSIFNVNYFKAPNLRLHSTYIYAVCALCTFYAHLYNVYKRKSIQTTVMTLKKIERLIITK